MTRSGQANFPAGGAVLIGLGVLAAAAGEEARAQQSTTSASGLEEVIVTARKREESLRDVPLAVTAFDQAALADLGARNLEDLSYHAPGLQFSSQALSEPGRAFTRIRFRGMDLNTTPNPTQEIASVFMDGIYLPGSVSSVPVEDLERVEVIRGPQSALFGRATFGGAVNFVTKVPGMEPRGRVMASAAEDADYEVSVSYEGPLFSDRLAFRVGARLFDFGGQYRSAADGGRLGQQSTQSAHAALFAKLTDDLSARLTVRVFEDEDGPVAGFYLGGADRNCGPFTDPSVPPGPAFSSTAFFCGKLPNVDLSTRGPETVVTPQIQSIFLDNALGYGPLADAPRLDGLGLKRRSQFASLSMDYSFGDGWLFTSNTGFTDEETSNLRDWDLDTVHGWYASGPQQNESFTQELRLQSPGNRRLNWLVGATAFRQDYSTPDAGGLFVLFRPGLAPFIAQNPVGRNEAETLSAFGALGYDVTDRFTLNLEGRYQRDEISFQSSAANSPQLEAAYNSFLPRVILKYRTGERSHGYLTYAEGNRPGSFNPELVAATPAVRDQIRALTGAGIDIEEEKLINYELGYKAGFLEGRAFVSAAAYYMPWTNQQTRFSIPVVDPDNPASDPATGIRLVQVTVNAGKTDLWGIELEGSARLTDHWRANASFGWAASEYKSFICLFCARFTGNPDVAGRSVPRFPEYSGSVGASYVRAISDRTSIVLRGDAMYFGDAYVDESNLAQTAAYWLANLRAGIQRDQVRTEIFVKNLFDDDSYLAASRNTDFRTGFDFSQQGVVVTPPRARQFGVRVIAEF